MRKRHHFVMYTNQTNKFRYIPIQWLSGQSGAQKQMKQMEIRYRIRNNKES
jgi:hypothetical protein